MTFPSNLTIHRSPEDAALGEEGNIYPKGEIWKAKNLEILKTGIWKQGRIDRSSKARPPKFSVEYARYLSNNHTISQLEWTPAQRGPYHGNNAKKERMDFRSGAFFMLGYT